MPRTRSSNANNAPGFTLPSDYTFAQGGRLVHKDTYQRFQKLFNAAKNRDPDEHGMHIYNDFFGYAILDLVDSTLSSIHTLVVKKKYRDAWRALDCLGRFSDDLQDWKQVDDGERVEATIKAYGAMLVATIRGLEKDDALNEVDIPNLEEALQSFARSFDSGSDAEEFFNNIVRAYGRKLFGDRTDEERKNIWRSRWEAYVAFVKALPDEEREKRGEMVPDEDGEKDKDADGEDGEGSEDNDDDDDGEAWFGDVNVKDAQKTHRDFAVSRTWKEYKDALAGSPNVPLRGPPTWNLTEWTDEDKRPFLFKNFE
ncbi:hypothetical protein C8Q78DRAFT_1003597 [Trametes maxima]|nr:hypothetical protein C8Q78DRAFT_1003597 [Trametes maxima]